MRDGPIPPEDHPLTPEPIRRVLKEEQHKKLLEQLYGENVKEDPPVFKRTLRGTLYLWTFYVTLAYFNLLGEVQVYWNKLLDFLHW